MEVVKASGFNGLDIAAVMGDGERVKELIEEKKMDVKGVDGRGGTVLFNAVMAG